MIERKHCKWYNEEMCTNVDSPCVADYCPVVQYPELCKYREPTIPQAPLLSAKELQKLISSKWYKSLHELSTEAKVAYKWVMMAIRGEKIPEEYTRRLTEFLNSL